MKLRRFREARLAAREGLGTGQPRSVEVAMNALCAIEFRSGRGRKEIRGLPARGGVLRETYGAANTVDLTNFAEASRSLFARRSRASRARGHAGADSRIRQSVARPR